MGKQFRLARGEDVSAPILILGGSGKTGRRLAKQLRKQGAVVRIAARRIEGPESARFDWSDTATWDGAYKGARAAYLVPPPRGGDASAAMIAFVKQALDAGVKRFVLLSASLLPAGGPGAGRVHQWLSESAPEWAVLRPSWFMQNFTEGVHLDTIRDESAIYSAAGDGRVGFVSAEDIAACAASVLTVDRAPNADFVLTGPEALSYDNVAARVSGVAGRAIAHQRIDAKALAKRYEAKGLPAQAAMVLAAMDGMISAGAEDRTTGAVRLLTGRDPVNFEAFALAEGVVWQRYPAGRLGVG